MRGQAREQRRLDVIGGPLQEPRQVWPVRLEAQLHLRRLGSGDDQRIRRARPQLVEPAVALLDQSGDLLRARNLLDRVELELDPGPVGPSAAPRNWFSVSRNAESGMLLTRPTVSGRGSGRISSKCHVRCLPRFLFLLTARRSQIFLLEPAAAFDAAADPARADPRAPTRRRERDCSTGRVDGDVSSAINSRCRARRPRWCRPWIDDSVRPRRSAISPGVRPITWRRTTTSRCSWGSAASASRTVCT